MPTFTRTVLAGTVLSCLSSAMLLHAAETRTPTPEEFRELIRQYNRGGSAVLAWLKIALALSTIAYASLGGPVLHRADGVIPPHNPLHHHRQPR